MLAKIIGWGRQMYRLSYWKEAHRFLVFCIRAALHAPAMNRLAAFFEETELRRKIIAQNPYPLEQATRAFFYAGSTFEERAKLIREHYELIEERLEAQAAYEISTCTKPYEIWRAEELPFFAVLTFETGQRKEGLMSLILYYGEPRVTLYQIIFWLAKDKGGEDALFIGAMQGPNAENAKDIIKETTKLAHRYRTKNLALYMTQAVTRTLGVRHIYAVTNDGYYAMNHVRRDRKLKTDFGAFWEEAGGHILADKRFYELPLIEPRKTYEEIPTRKRALYRRRFAFLDEVDARIAERMGEILKA